MSKQHKEQVVKNLRRIWNVRKKEMSITQVEAAKKLNWTQGALSQYLNAITEMSPQTIIKIANFLDVSPQEIDPCIDDALPNIESRTVEYEICNNSYKELSDQQVFWDTKIEDFCIRACENIYVEVDGGLSQSWQMLKGMLFVCIDVAKKAYAPRMSTNMLYYLVIQKGKNEFEIFSEKRLPPTGKLEKCFLITDLAMY